MEDDGRRWQPFRGRGVIHMPVSRLFGALRGQGLLEYALILMLVAIVVFAMITIFGPAVGNIYSNIISNF